MNGQDAGPPDRRSEELRRLWLAGDHVAWSRLWWLHRDVL